MRYLALTFAAVVLGGPALSAVLSRAARPDRRHRSTITEEPAFRQRLGRPETSIFAGVVEVTSIRPA